MAHIEDRWLKAVVCADGKPQQERTGRYGNGLRWRARYLDPDGVHSPVVYFIRNGSRVKIGWTTNLKARLRSLSLPVPAVMLTLPGGPAEETRLHHKFRAARDGKTEWFEVTPEIERFIIQRLTGEGADVVSPGAETASRDGRRRYCETKSA